MVTKIYGILLVGLSVDCSSWVKAGLISREDMLDRNWAYWTTFSAVCITFLHCDESHKCLHS